MFCDCFKSLEKSIHLRWRSSLFFVWSDRHPELCFAKWNVSNSMWEHSKFPRCVAVVGCKSRPQDCQDPLISTESGNHHWWLMLDTDDSRWSTIFFWYPTLDEFFGPSNQEPVELSWTCPLPSSATHRNHGAFPVGHRKTPWCEAIDPEQSP